MSAELNFHQLYLFYTVVRLENVSQAAGQLHISQPAVSAQVRELEQMLGVPLLHRLPRGVALTDAGRMVFDYARRLFTLAEELQAAVQDLRGLRAGSLTIGGSLTAGESFLPAMMKRFKECYPTMEPVLVLGNSAEILARIARRELEIGVIGTDVVSKDLVAVPLLGRRDSDRSRSNVPLGGATAPAPGTSAEPALCHAGRGFGHASDRRNVLARAGADGPGGDGRREP